MRKKLLNFITGYIQTHGYAPTVQEMANGVNLKSKSTVHGYLMDLFTSGVIETDHPGAPRAIRVPGYYFTKEKWIPVENGYPKERGYYLLSFHGQNKAHFGRYEIDKEGNGTFYFIQDGSRPCTAYNMFVSAWMRIPEAYKEEK